MKSKNSTKIHALTIRDAIQKIAVGPDRGRDITRAHAKAIMQEILAGKVDEVQTAVFLIALRMKRESMDEFLGLFDALQECFRPIIADVSELVCLADPFDGYVRTTTITPFIAPVLAACGLPALMHGVESVGPKHGVTSHKVYKLAGVDTSQSAEQASVHLRQAAWAYVDQRQYAPRLYALGSLRDRIVKRSALTTLERLLMPIRASDATHLVLGYVHKAYPEIYATIARAAGYDSTLLLKGVEGGLAPALNKPLRQFFLTGALPTDVIEEKEIVESHLLFSSDTAALGAQNGAACVEQCLNTGLAVLDGHGDLDRNADSDADYAKARASLCLAAGHILYAHGISISLSEAVVKVQNCLDNGSAKKRFNSLRNL